jgi:hypothetical protein
MSYIYLYEYCKEEDCEIVALYYVLSHALAVGYSSQYAGEAARALVSVYKRLQREVNLSSLHICSIGTYYLLIDLSLLLLPAAA